MRRVRDFLIDRLTGDVVVKNGDLQLVADEPGNGAAVQQAVRLRLGFFLEEWFLDESIGMPYWQRILIKNPNLVETREHFRRRLLGTPGAKEIITLDIEYDPAGRLLSPSFTLRSDVGKVTSG